MRSYRPNIADADRDLAWFISSHWHCGTSFALLNIHINHYSTNATASGGHCSVTCSCSAAVQLLSLSGNVNTKLPES